MLKFLLFWNRLFWPLECSLTWNKGKTTQAQLHVNGKNERDNIIKSWTIHKANEQVEALKVTNKLESLEVKLTSLIDRTVKKDLKSPVKKSKTAMAKILKDFLRVHHCRNRAENKS